MVSGRALSVSQSPGNLCPYAFTVATASSTGLLLKMSGLKVTSIKIDPYMNIDAGTMAPTEHGEYYVSQRCEEPICFAQARFTS